MYVPYFKSRERPVLYSQYRLQGKSMRESAIRAGYSRNTANIAHEALEPRHELRIREALIQVDASSMHVAQALKDALNAGRVHILEDGPVETDVPDHKIRMDAAKLIAQITGELDTKTQVAVQINLPGVAVDAAAWGDDE